MAGPLKITSSGSFKKTFSFFDSMSKSDIFASLNKYGQAGVNALAAATPVDSGLSSESWTYEITKSGGKYTIEWHNTNVVNGTPVVILIQYGHGTGTGGYVQGRDFINPVIQPLFDEIANNVWKAVTSA